MTPLASPGTDPNAMDPRLFEQLLGAPLDEYFDFIDDASLSVAGTGEMPQVGLVATVTDEVIANQRIDRLVSMARSLGPMAGDLSVTEEQHGNTTIHVISIGNSEADGAPQSVSLAVAGGRLYLGTSGFVTTALDQTAADSLASNDDYRTALAAGGANNSGIVFGDITALRSMAEAKMSDAERAEYVADAQPFLEPLSHFMVVNQTDGSIVVSNGFLYVE